jgi:hypothetical protein
MQNPPAQTSHHVINASFYCVHPKQEGPVKVFNSDHYLMAEYYRLTGSTKWQRVVPVTQREGVEKWLISHYPAGKTTQPR